MLVIQVQGPLKKMIRLVRHNIQNPTRSRGDQYSSLLDLVLTTIPDSVNTITHEHLAPLGCNQPAPRSSENYLRNYSRGKINMKSSIFFFYQLDWTQLFDDNNVEHNCIERTHIEGSRPIHTTSI